MCYPVFPCEAALEVFPPEIRSSEFFLLHLWVVIIVAALASSWVCLHQHLDRWLIAIPQTLFLDIYSS